MYDITNNSMAIGRPATMLAIWIAFSPPASNSPAAIAPSSRHQSTLIQFGGLVLPRAHKVQST
ncbi:hypothetical protein D3C86_2200170 [compost metagenome]